MVRVMKIFPRSEDDHSNCYRSDSKDESDKSGNDAFGVKIDDFYHKYAPRIFRAQKYAGLATNLRPAYFT